MPDVDLQLPGDIITAKSDDFLGIREATFSIIPWECQLEMGAALALRKKVFTVLHENNHFRHPMLKSFPNWRALEAHVLLLLH